MTKAIDELKQKIIKRIVSIDDIGALHEVVTCLDGIDAFCDSLAGNHTDYPIDSSTWYDRLLESAMSDYYSTIWEGDINE